MANDKKRFELTEKTKKVLSLLSIVAFFLITGFLAWYIGRPLVRMVSQPEAFRAWVDAHGWTGRLAYVGMMALQVIIAIIPGEPFEIVAGYAFGAVEGTLLCMAGAIIGSAIVFGFVRRFGIKVVEVFFSREKILSLKFLQNTKKLNTIVFIIYLIPGTPKDLLAYVIGLTPMKFSTWMLITAVARIPSVVTSTVGGNALGMQNYVFAIIVFVVTGALSAIGLILYNRLSKNGGEAEPVTDGAGALADPDDPEGPAA